MWCSSASARSTRASGCAANLMRLQQATHISVPQQGTIGSFHSSNGCFITHPARLVGSIGEDGQGARKDTAIQFCFSRF